MSTLEDILLEDLDDLKGLIRKGGRGIGASAARTQAVFSSLKLLRIEKCNKMRTLGLPASGVPNLECITIWECEEMLTQHTHDSHTL